MKKAYIIILLFLTLVSCQKARSPGKKLYLQYMDEISPNFQNKIISAISALNNQAGYEIISLSEKTGRPLVILNMVSDSIFAHARYLDYQCLIQIDESNQIINNSSPTQIDLKFILLHEIGHCYGFKHTNDSSNIMFPDYTGTQVMNQTQINQVLSEIQSFFQELYPETLL